LVERALRRSLVRTPAEQRGAVAETACSEMIERDLDHQLRHQRLPLGRPLAAPAARASRSAAGEAGRLDQLFDLRGQRLAIFVLEARRLAAVMQQALIVIEAEQQRADDFAAGRIAEAADNAVGS